MPRTRRITGLGESFYHITTRVVDQVFRFTPLENERNVELLRVVEDFSAVQVLSYCFMSNHLHILLRVSRRPKSVSETELLRRIGVLYGENFRQKVALRWNGLRKINALDDLSREQSIYLKRMYDMGEFMKTLKQRMTMSYNARNNRAGTLWEERYKSILLEGTPHVLSAVSAYIDLNPVRAGMVSDPARYRFSSYGEACRGSEIARCGLCRIYQEGDSIPTWDKVAPEYRIRIVLKATPDTDRAGMKLEDLYNAIKNEGAFSFSEIVGHRCSFFMQGIAFGSMRFIQWARHIPLRSAFRPPKKSLAHPNASLP